MELTAKEILRKHVFNLMRPSFQSSERTNQIVDAWLVMTEEKEAILAAMKEACLNCIDRAKGYYTDAEYITGDSKEDIINSLFPESK